jgi:hypothetical protein
VAISAVPEIGNKKRMIDKLKDTDPLDTDATLGIGWSEPECPIRPAFRPSCNLSVTIIIDLSAKKSG